MSHWSYLLISWIQSLPLAVIVVIVIVVMAAAAAAGYALFKWRRRQRRPNKYIPVIVGLVFAFLAYSVIDTKMAPLPAVGEENYASVNFEVDLTHGTADAGYIKAVLPFSAPTLTDTPVRVDIYNPQTPFPAGTYQVDLVDASPADYSVMAGTGCDKAGAAPDATPACVVTTANTNRLSFLWTINARNATQTHFTLRSDLLKMAPDSNWGALFRINETLLLSSLVLGTTRDNFAAISPTDNFAATAKQPKLSYNGINLDLSAGTLDRTLQVTPTLGITRITFDAIEFGVALIAGLLASSWLFALFSKRPQPVPAPVPVNAARQQDPRRRRSV